MRVKGGVELASGARGSWPAASAKEFFGLSPKTLFINLIL